MSPLARRGRWILLVLLTVVVTERLMQHGISLYIDGWQNVGWRRLLRPIGEVLFAGYVWWTGERWVKWLLCIHCLVSGARRLYLVSIITRVAWMFGKLQKASLIKTIWMIVVVSGSELLLASIQMATAVAVALLPSVRAFLAYQQREAHWKQVSMDDMEKWLESVRARPQYAQLTLDLLRAVDGFRLLEVIRDHIQLTTDGDYDAIAKLPPGQQMVHAIMLLEDEVNNGGFHQYFWNTRGQFAFMALEGYRRLGHEQNLRLILKAIESFFGEEAEQASFQTDRLDELVEKYHDARENSRLPDLDQESLDCCQDDLIAYAEAHLTEFVTQ